MIWTGTKTSVALASIALFATGCVLYESEYVTVGVQDGPGPEYLIVESPDGEFRTIEKPERALPDWTVEHKDGATYTIFRPEVTPSFVSFLGVDGGESISVQRPAQPDVSPYPDRYDLRWPAYPDVAPVTYSVLAGCNFDEFDEWTSDLVNVEEPLMSIWVPGCRDFQVRVVAHNADGVPLATLVWPISADSAFETVDLPDRWDPMVVHRRDVEIPADTTSLRFEFETRLYSTNITIDVRDRTRVTAELHVPPEGGPEHLFAIAEDGRYSTISNGYAPGSTPLELPPWPPRPLAPSVDSVARLVTWDTRGVGQHGQHDLAAVTFDANGDGVAEWNVIDRRAPSEIEIPRLPAMFDSLLPSLDTSVPTVILRFDDEDFFIASYGW